MKYHKHVFYNSHLFQTNCKGFNSLYMALLPVAILIPNVVLYAGRVVSGYSEISSALFVPNHCHPSQVPCI